MTAHRDLRGQLVWSLPKGLIEKHETPDAAALREVEEETGLRGKIVADLGRVAYWFYSKEQRARIHKTVYFYLLECTGGDITRHDWEVEEVKWLPIDQAREILAYSGEREILDRARERLSAAT